MSVSNGGVIGPDNVPNLTPAVPAVPAQSEVIANFTSPEHILLNLELQQ